jgi:hypothetical protein
MCCGRNRAGFRPPAQSSVSAAPPPPARFHRGPRFEYLGKTALTVVGPVTGARYRFDRAGAQLPVNPYDSPGLARIAALRLIA